MTRSSDFSRSQYTASLYDCKQIYDAATEFIKNSTPSDGPPSIGMLIDRGMIKSNVAEHMFNAAGEYVISYEPTGRAKQLKVRFFSRDIVVEYAEGGGYIMPWKQWKQFKKTKT